MLIPIGLDQANMRRRPYVTFAIIAACVLIHIVKNFTAASGFDQSLLDFFSYWETRPYLTLSTEDWQALEETGMFDTSILREVMNEVREAADDPNYQDDFYFETKPDSRAELREQQNQLRALLDDLLAAVAADPDRRFGFHAEKVSILGAIGHVFLHADFWHLLGNLLFLYVTAPFVEDRWNRPLFLGFYLFGGIFSGVMWAFHADSGYLIGASGAVSACMGAFLVNFHSRKIHFFYMFFFIIRGTFYALAWIVLPLYLLMELMFAFLNDAMGGVSNVAHWAHVWGFTFGFVFALGLKKTGLETRFSDEGIDLDDPRHNAALAARMADEDGRPEDALKILREALVKQPENMIYWREMWDQALHMNREREIGEAGRKLLRYNLQEKNPMEAAYYWNQMAERDLDLPDMVLANLTKQLEEIGETDQAAAVLEQLCERGAGIPINKLVALTKLAAKIDPRFALHFADIALADTSLDANARERLQSQRQVWAKADAARPARPDADGSIALSDDGFRPGQSPIATAPEQTFSGSEPASIALSIDDSGPSSGDEVENPAVRATSANDPMMMVLNIQAFPAIPERLERSGITLMVQGKHRKKVAFEHIKAIACAGIKPSAGEMEKPYLVLDLVIDDLTKPRDRHRLFRLTSNHFRPQELVPKSANGKDAFFMIARAIAKHANAPALPNQAALKGQTIAAFNSLDAMNAKIYTNS